MWRNALGGPACSRGPGAGYGWAAVELLTLPTPEGAPARPARPGPAEWRRQGGERGKRQLRSARCSARFLPVQTDGKVRSLEVRSGKEESIGQLYLGQRGSRDSGLDLETRLDPTTESPFPLTLSRGFFVACWPPSGLIIFFWSGGEDASKKVFRLRGLCLGVLKNKNHFLG